MWLVQMQAQCAPNCIKSMGRPKGFSQGKQKKKKKPLMLAKGLLLSCIYMYWTKT